MPLLGVSGVAMKWHYEGVSPRTEVRAADADREAVAERLRQAVDEGRLDLHEYDERLGQVYAAKTYGELDRVLVDLPAPPPARPAETPARQPRQDRGARHWLVAYWSSWAQVVGICVAIWAATAIAAGEFLYFWPFWVAVPWGAVLLCGTVSGLVSGQPQRCTARQRH